jgi:hypothetical protein
MHEQNRIEDERSRREMEMQIEEMLNKDFELEE